MSKQFQVKSDIIVAIASGYTIVRDEVVNMYEWVLFDADDTLFDFDAFRGLQRMLTQYEVNFTEQDFADYQVINEALWLAYQNGEINAQQLQENRFDAWAQKLAIPAMELNNAFLTAMAEICKPLDGAIALLSALKGKVKMGIITNGFSQLQQTRINKTGLADHFEFLVISEQVGVAKPDPAIFEHALDLMKQPARNKVLMVGDNPDSDILGGINAGLHTCWLNPANKPLPQDLKPNYQVNSLTALHELLFTKA